MDEPGFETAVSTYHGEIHRYLRRVAARVGEADELAQETFLRAYRAWRTLGPDANVRAWLFTIATNVIRNQARSERRRYVAHAEVMAAGRGATEVGGPEAEALARETRALTEAAIGALPFKQRAAFVLRKLHDLDYDIIGRSLDCSAESARAHVFQALRKIRTSLNGHIAPAQEPAR